MLANICLINIMYDVCDVRFQIIKYIFLFEYLPNADKKKRHTEE